MTKKTLRSMRVSGQKVLLRVDWDVPLENGAVADDTRIMATLETIHDLLEHDNAVTVISHLGRPKEPASTYSLRQLMPLLESHRLPIQFVDDVVGEKAIRARKTLKEGQLLLLENLRFDAGEQAAEMAFAKKLAMGADVYVNDGFGVMHRPHATEIHLPTLLPSAAGYLVENEVQILSSVRDMPDRPLIVFMGGIKIETKLGVLLSLAPQTDRVIVGGGIATALWSLAGKQVGASIHDAEQENLLKNALSPNLLSRIILPLDIVALAPNGTTRVTDIDGLGVDESIVDVGPKTMATFERHCHEAQTIIWNGPFGWFEKGFDEGTAALAKTIVSSKARTIIGGGETSLLVHRLGLRDRFTHVSTGGGAMLQFLEGKPLPGLEALPEAPIGDLV